MEKSNSSDHSQDSTTTQKKPKKAISVAAKRCQRTTVGTPLPSANPAKKQDKRPTGTPLPSANPAKKQDKRPSAPVLKCVPSPQENASSSTKNRKKKVKPRYFLRPERAPLREVAPWFTKGSVLYIPYYRGEGELLVPDTLGELLSYLDPVERKDIRPAVYIPSQRVCQRLLQWRTQAFLSPTHASTLFCQLPPLERYSERSYSVQGVRRVLYSYESGNPHCWSPHFICAFTHIYEHHYADFLVDAHAIPERLKSSSGGHDPFPGLPKYDGIPKKYKNFFIRNAKAIILERMQQLYRKKADRKINMHKEGYTLLSPSELRKRESAAYKRGRKDLLRELKEAGVLGRSTDVDAPTPLETDTPYDDPSTLSQSGADFLDNYEPEY